MSYRNIEYLHRRRIIYRRLPVYDQPTQTFEWGNYYEQGTYECYELFRSNAKITTYRSLKWHLLVLKYLNDNLTTNVFINLAKYISNKDNGFITFMIPRKLLAIIINEVVVHDFETPPKNKLRKVIFKDGCGLDVTEKLKIVGSLIGRTKITQETIYDAMLEIHHNEQLITIQNLAGICKCSIRTIHRNMCKQLKLEKEQLNKELHEKI